MIKPFISKITFMPKVGGSYACDALYSTERLTRIVDDLDCDLERITTIKGIIATILRNDPLFINKKMEDAIELIKEIFRVQGYTATIKKYTKAKYSISSQGGITVWIEYGEPYTPVRP